MARLLRPASVHPRAECGRRHDQSLAGAHRRYGDGSISRESTRRPPGALHGNPVRAAIAALEEPALRFRDRSGPLRLLVLGGSQGARALNEAVPAALAQLAPEHRPVVRHQAGVRHLDAARAAYARAGVEADLSAFVDDMAEAYGWADLVLCRAGALTVAELAAAGVGFDPGALSLCRGRSPDRKRALPGGRRRRALLPEAELSAPRLADS